MNILKRRIRFEIKCGQWTAWLTDEEMRRYAVGDRAREIKSVIIEEIMSYVDAIKYMGIVK